jgi:hypothetical protein
MRHVARQPATAKDVVPAQDCEPLLAEDMAAVANELLRGYMALSGRGYRPRRIAFAMMGATINLFDVLDLNAELLPLLRATEDRVKGRHRSSKPHTKSV